MVSGVKDVTEGAQKFGHDFYIRNKEKVHNNTCPETFNL
jgi:hypothetical protein